MGLTKTQIFSTKQNELATIFKVLANPARVAILQYISTQKACICNDIVDEIGLAQPTISQHLKELKSIDLIHGAIDGKKVCYCINLKKWKKIQDLLNSFFDKSYTPFSNAIKSQLVSFVLSKLPSINTSPSSLMIPFLLFVFFN